jgi:hypothetical protein
MRRSIEKRREVVSTTSAAYCLSPFDAYEQGRLLVERVLTVTLKGGRVSLARGWELAVTFLFERRQVVRTGVRIVAGQEFCVGSRSEVGRRDHQPGRGSKRLHVRKILALGAASALLGAAVGCDGGKTIVRTGDDAGQYVDDLLRGANPNDYRVAQDATPIARAAVNDSDSLTNLVAIFQERTNETCFVVALVKSVGEPDPNATERLRSLRAALVRSDSRQQGISDEVTNTVLESAQSLSQSTFAFVDKACGP